MARLRTLLRVDSLSERVAWICVLALVSLAIFGGKVLVWLSPEQATLAATLVESPLDPWGRPWAVTLHSGAVWVSYSRGSNGVDEQTTGDDIVPQPEPFQLHYVLLARHSEISWGCAASLAWCILIPCRRGPLSQGKCRELGRIAVMAALPCGVTVGLVCLARDTLPDVDPSSLIVFAVTPGWMAVGGTLSLLWLLVAVVVRQRTAASEERGLSPRQSE